MPSRHISQCPKPVLTIAEAHLLQCSLPPLATQEAHPHQSKAKDSANCEHEQGTCVFSANQRGVDNAAQSELRLLEQAEAI
jgi:hypothetical protein